MSTGSQLHRHILRNAVDSQYFTCTRCHETDFVHIHTFTVDGKLMESMHNFSEVVDEGLN
jgi:hypothetical protein